jgi:putative ABC transport system ATP-binding protein
MKLTAEHLKRTYKSGASRVTALDDVSLELRSGEFSLLMGPSGSGKSTLLAALSGLIPPDSGRVIALGHDLWNMPEQKREEFRRQWVGFIFQGYNLFPGLNVREQLEMVLEWSAELARGEARRKVEGLLGLLGLEKKGDRSPDELSGGERQRVAIARALIKEPLLIFADEPTSALDWHRGHQIVEILRDAAQQRGAILAVVSHDNRIIPYADQVLSLEDGQLKPPEHESHPETRRAQ